jgi:hypothetical protein
MMCRKKIENSWYYAYGTMMLIPPKLLKAIRKCERKTGKKLIGGKVNFKKAEE